MGVRVDEAGCHGPAAGVELGHLAAGRQVAFGAGPGDDAGLDEHGGINDLADRSSDAVGVRSETSDVADEQGLHRAPVGSFSGLVADET